LKTQPQQIENMSAEKREIDPTAGLRTRGCAVCNHVIKTARDFFSKWQYALSADEQAQRSFARELGFCSLHLWQLHGMSSPWGGSIGFAALTENVSQLLAKADCDVAEANVQEILRTPENCRVCQLLEVAQAAYIKQLGRFLIDEKGRQLYERSQGVCLRHLGQLLAVTSYEIRRFILATASRRFEQITQQMRGYAAKRDAIRRDLISADEEDAYLRALVHLAGAREYSAP
jgi:hypothetical protein